MEWQNVSSDTLSEMGKITNFDDLENQDQFTKKSDLPDQDQIMILNIKVMIILFRKTMAKSQAFQMETMLKIIANLFKLLLIFYNF